MTTSITDEIIVVGDTTTFILNALRNGAVWDISGADVTLRLVGPNGTTTLNNATVTDGPAGEAQYTVDTDFLDEQGDWIRQWTVSKGGVILSSEPLGFPVLPLYTT